MRKIYSLLFIILASACNSNKSELENCIEAIKKEGFAYTIDYYTFNYKQSRGSKASFDIDINSKDTLISLSLVYEKGKPLIINMYSKDYKDKNSKYNYIEFNQKKDTLLWTQSDDPTMPTTTYIFGRYYFLYSRDNLTTPGQKKYFELHRDSLIKVRGNNLPELPEI